VTLFVLGEFDSSTLIYEENLGGGIWIGNFLRVWSGSHVEVLRRGDNLCFFCAIGGTNVFLLCNWGQLVLLLCNWGNFKCSLGGFCGALTHYGVI
jgi:hypothetical protein